MMKVGHPMKNEEFNLLGLEYCQDNYYQNADMAKAEDILPGRIYRCYGIRKNEKVQFDKKEYKLYLNINAYYYRLSVDLNSRKLIKSRTIKGSKKFYFDLNMLSQFCRLEVLNNEISMIAVSQALISACSR